LKKTDKLLVALCCFFNKIVHKTIYYIELTLFLSEKSLVIAIYFDIGQSPELIASENFLAREPVLPSVERIECFSMLNQVSGIN
jgi:hypothetical protein